MTTPGHDDAVGFKKLVGLCDRPGRKAQVSSQLPHGREAVAHFEAPGSGMFINLTPDLFSEWNEGSLINHEFGSSHPDCVRARGWLLPGALTNQTRAPKASGRKPRLASRKPSIHHLFASSNGPHGPKTTVGSRNNTPEACKAATTIAPLSELRTPACRSARSADAGRD